MEYDMNLRVREMAVQRLDDAVEQMKMSSTAEKYPQLVRLLVESCLWLIRDWPGQQIDDVESVRASRKEVEGRLRQFLRARPPRTCEMESNILLVSDAILTISEQWPVDKSDQPSPANEPIIAPQRVITAQKRPHHQNGPAFAATPVNGQSPAANGRPVYGTPGPSSQQPAAKITRIVATPQQLSNSAVNSFPQPTPYRSWEQPHRMPQSNNAGTPSRLWSFFTKMMGESGENLARCNVCQKVVPRQNHGTSGMKNHLKAYHPQEFAALDRDPSSRPEPARSSPPFVTMQEQQPRKRTASPEKTPPSVSAIVAALHGGPPTVCLSDDGSYSPLFNEATVKEEEVDFEEEMEKYKAATKINAGEPNEAERAMLNEQLASLQKSRAVTSDIWTYFTKDDHPNGEKFGSCKLCDWSKKIHNHGTNGMWGHLKKHHPPEYSILKPYEYNPAVHGQFIPSTMPGCAVVPGGSVVIVPGGTLPSNLVLPRPVEAGEDAVKDEEDKL